MLLMNLVPTNMIVWSALTEYDFDESVAYIVPFIGKMTAEFAALVIIETAILRYLTEFVWKRIPPTDHEFTVNFLTIFNVCFSLSTSVIMIVSGNLK